MQRDKSSEGEESGTCSVPKRNHFADRVRTETVPSKLAFEPPHLVDNELQCASEERGRREMAANARLDGLRAGPVFAERDDPARWAIGPLRNS